MDYQYLRLNGQNTTKNQCGLIIFMDYQDKSQLYKNQRSIHGLSR